MNRDLTIVISTLAIILAFIILLAMGIHALYEIIPIGYNGQNFLQGM